MTTQNLGLPQPGSRQARALRLVAQSAVIVAFCFVQTPRWIAPDTKLDLVVDPGRLLSRALTLWDPGAAAGQLQNQAYGYLFPMGPFFWLGAHSPLPEWVVQRLWWVLVLLVGFHGMRSLLERLATGTETSRTIAAFAFALAPRMLEGLGAVSSEIWPMAVAPWVLVPLIRAGGRERTAAARSATAFLCAGAVNAVASLAILVLPAWWILTRQRPARRPLLIWWAVFVAGVSVWWAGPLVLLGRYSPPFLDWIESSAITTAGASLTESLRGTTQWIAAVTGARGPQWPAAWEILTLAPVVGMGLALVTVGLAGLVLADHTWALFARGGLVLGLLLVTAGHVGPVPAPRADTVAHLLDTALSPFRNTHKFEPVIRVVLCIGLAHVLPLASGALVRLGARPRWIVTGVAALAVACQVAAPAFMGVSQRGQFLEVPPYWRTASGWLGANPSPGRTLVLPGAAAPASFWGDPRDEPLQPLATSPWIVRDAVPLGSGGATRLLNDVEARVASGWGGTELRNDLARLGVSRVLVRNDLNYRATGAPAPMVVDSALRSAGGRPVHGFGPQVGGSDTRGLVIDGGREQPTTALLVYDLQTATTIVPSQIARASSVLTVAGGPEGLAMLPDASATTVMSSDTASRRAVGAADGSVVLTDTLQRREASFAAVRQNYGPALGAEEAYTARRAVHDWLPSWLPVGGPLLVAAQTVSDLVGASSVSASSSLAYPDLGQSRDLTAVPESAFDASGDTMWASAGYQAAGQHLEVHWDREVAVPASVSAVFDMEQGADVAAVTVTTERGTVRTPLSSPAATGADAARYAVTLGAPKGPSRFLRLTVEEVRPGRQTVRLRDLGLASLPRVESWLRLPDPGRSSVAGVLLQSSPSRVPACVPDASGVVHCNPDASRTGEGETDLRRVFTLPSATRFDGVGTVFPRDEASVRRLLARPDRITAKASSSWLPGGSTAPELVLDGDDRTFWASDPTERTPALTIAFPTKRTFSGLRLTTAEAVTGRRITTVDVTVGSKTYRRDVSADGTVDLPRRTARSVRVTVVAATRVSNVRGTAVVGPAPVVLGELNLLGDPWPTGGQDLVGVPCGFGPRLQVNGTEYPTRVEGTRAAVVAGQPLTLTVCAPLSLGRGVQRLRLLASGEFGARTLTLTKAGTSLSRATAAPAGTVTPGSWSATDRTVLPDSPTGGLGVLTIRENANAGWTARTAGKDLVAVTVDGFAQGWVAPPGTSTGVDLRFAPQVPFRWALALGLLLALVVVGAAVSSLRGGRGATEVVSPEVRLTPAIGAVAAATGLALLGGWWGIAAALVVVLLRLTPVRSQMPTRTWRATRDLVLPGLLAAGWILWGAVAPWPRPWATNRDAVSQVLALFVLALAVVPLHPLGRTRRTASVRASRCAGRTGPVAWVSSRWRGSRPAG